MTGNENKTDNYFTRINNAFYSSGTCYGFDEKKSIGNSVNVPRTNR